MINVKVNDLIIPEKISRCWYEDIPNLTSIWSFKLLTVSTLETSKVIVFPVNALTNICIPIILE